MAASEDRYQEWVVSTEAARTKRKGKMMDRILCNRDFAQIPLEHLRVVLKRPE